MQAPGKEVTVICTARMGDYRSHIRVLILLIQCYPSMKHDLLFIAREACTAYTGGCSTAGAMHAHGTQGAITPLQAVICADNID